MSNSTNKLYRIMLGEYPDVLDVEQVGNILKVSRKTVYRLMRLDELSHLKVGREYRVPKVLLIQYLIRTKADETTDTDEKYSGDE